MNAIDKSTKGLRIAVPASELEGFTPDQLSNLRELVEDEAFRLAFVIRVRNNLAGEPARPCHRLPCDRAYRGTIHERDDEGHVQHWVGQAGSAGQGWRVALSAQDDDDWAVVVDVHGDGDYTPVETPALQGFGGDEHNTDAATAEALRNAADLGAAISKAAVLAGCYRTGRTMR